MEEAERNLAAVKLDEFEEEQVEEQAQEPEAEQQESPKEEEPVEEQHKGRGKKRGAEDGGDG